MVETEEKCPLCASLSPHFFTDRTGKIYRHCIKCSGVFLSPLFYLNKHDEFARYNTHNNIVSDINYQRFVSDLVGLIKTKERKNTLGLDFGCGPGPVIQHLLIREGFHLLTYDPYYQPDKNVLAKVYDYIVSCEVIEHFNAPNVSFSLLKNLLKPQASLYLKTDVLYDLSVQNFEKWGYRNDPTHVFFYTLKTFEFIKKEYNFSSLEIQARTIILRN